MNLGLQVMWGLGVLAGLGIAFANFRFVMRCAGGNKSWKKYYRVFVGCCGIYFAAVYLIALMGGLSIYLVRSGSLTVGGIVLLMLLNIADVIIDERECQ